jgi:hypothetical protein
MKTHKSVHRERMATMKALAAPPSDDLPDWTDPGLETSRILHGPEGGGPMTSARRAPHESCIGSGLKLQNPWGSRRVGLREQRWRRRLRGE